MARRGIISILIICIILFIISLFEYAAVSKNSYGSIRRRDSFKAHKLYSDLRNSLATDEPPLNDTNRSRRCEPMHVGFVCSGHKSNLYLMTLLKSILFHRNKPLHFHLIVNKFSDKVLRTLFETWDIPQVTVSFYDMNDYLPDIRWVPNSHYSGIYGLLKLLFPTVLPNVEKIIILDTDLIFTSDIDELWQLFNNFDYLHAIGLVENESDFYLSKKSTIWPAIGRGYNTGVILYRLDRLRNMQWDKLWTRVSKKAALMYGSTSLGDQDIMNTVLKQYPHLVYDVPCYWNTQLSDHTRSESCYKNNKIKVVHWNSPKKFNVNNRDGEYFRSIYKTFLEMNGDLVRSVLYDCHNISGDNSQNQRDVCDDFTKGTLNKWRTLLFFRNFEYIPVDYDVTFVAQLSYDRLQMVEELTKHWEGPISLTLYVTDPEFQQANKYLENSEILQERTNIAYHAVFKNGDYHPINMLRNVGLRNVNTPYVFLADIDFLPMFGLYNVIRNTLSASPKGFTKKALIIPAFESQRYRNRFPRNKVELLQMLENKSLFTFRFDVWASGHSPTNYTRWRNAKSPYTVKWEPDFEPYVVVRRDVTEYDGRFMGFGWNKVSHIMELECQDYEFLVMHNAFIVHQPHSPSYDIAKFRMSPIYRMCLQNLKELFVEGLKTKYGRSFDNKKVSIDPIIT